MFLHTDSTEEVEEQGRILSSNEYAALLSKRPDIFEAEKDKRLKVILPITYTLGFMGLFFMSTIDLHTFGPGFAESRMQTHTVTLSSQEVTFPKDDPEEVTPVPQTQERTIRPPAEVVQPVSPPRRGTGSNAADVTKKGIFEAIASANIMTNMGDVFGSEGYASGLDKILDGQKGFVKGGTSGSGRKDIASIGDGAGIGGPGWGGNSGGIGGIEGLYGTPGASIQLVKTTPKLDVSKPTDDSGTLGGGRNRKDIMTVVRRNLSALRYAYNKHLSTHPSNGGTIKVKWAIDEFGNVLHCSVIGSNMDDKEFEAAIIKKIKLWKFDKIAKPGDVTEVIYPFVFKV